MAVPVITSGEQQNWVMVCTLNGMADPVQDQGAPSVSSVHTILIHGSALPLMLFSLIGPGFTLLSLLQSGNLPINSKATFLQCWEHKEKEASLSASARTLLGKASGLALLMGQALAWSLELENGGAMFTPD